MISGQKVVCINDKVAPEIRALYSHWIKEGVTYVVRDVFTGEFYHPDGRAYEIGITLRGMRNPTPQLLGASERGFNVERFRPIEERPVKQRKEVEVFA